MTADPRAAGAAPAGGNPGAGVAPPAGIAAPAVSGPRGRPAVAVVASLLLAGVGIALIVVMSAQAAALRAALERGPVASVSDVEESQYRGALPPPLLRLPDVDLTSSQGGTFNPLADSDRPLTMYYTGYTDCPDVCPTTLATVAAALRSLVGGGGVDPDDIQVVLATTDPRRDTAPVLREYLARFDGRWIGLTGASDSLLTLTRALGLPDPTDNGTVHTPQLTAFDENGRPVLAWPDGVTPDDLRHDLPLLLAQP